MYTGNYLLTVFAVISVSSYILHAWNNTSFPVHVTKLLGKLKLLKKESIAELDSVYSRDDWTLWSAVNMPDFFVSWFNCSICQTPYVAGVISWLILFKLGHFSVSYSFLGWCISLICIVKLQGTMGGSVVVPKQVPAAKSESAPVDILKATPSTIQAMSASLPFVAPKIDLTALQNEQVITPDQAQTISKTILETKLAEAKTESLKQLEAAADSYNLWQKEMGIKMQTGPNGEQMVVGYNPILLETMKFFRPEEPCTFQGCEALRKEYTKELDIKGVDCPTCVKSDLQRKYMILVKRAIEASK